MRERVMRVSPWSWEEEQRMLDREEAMRLARPVRPSLSVVPKRCTTCREWSSADDRGDCLKCGAPYAAAPLDGLPIVRGD
jgi:hypothetical protein